MVRSERTRVKRRLSHAVWLGPVLVAGATACSAVIGLDDFDKIECTGGRCDAGAPFDGSVTPRDDGGTDARVDAGPGAEEAAWAKWPIPNPKDAGPDGSMAVAKLAAGGSGEVVDQVTGLIWRAGNEAPGTLEEARGTCEGIPGYRLPKRIELVTLLDHSMTGTLSKSDPMLGMTALPYWSSSEVRPLADPPSYWAVDFGAGTVKRVAASTVAQVRCVKGAP